MGTMRGKQGRAAREGSRCAPDSFGVRSGWGIRGACAPVYFGRINLVDGGDVLLEVRVHWRRQAQELAHDHLANKEEDWGECGGAQRPAHHHLLTRMYLKDSGVGQ